MRRAPPALRIVPSRLSLAAHAALATAVAGLAWWFAPAGVAGFATLALGGVLISVAVGRPRGELRGELQRESRGELRGELQREPRGEVQRAPRGMPLTAAGLSWRWRGADGAWRNVSLDCDYLGPWLIGLRLDGRRMWLWPDSADAAALRELRRWLVARR